MKSQAHKRIHCAAAISMITLLMSGCAPKEAAVDTDPVAIRIGERDIRLSELQAQIDFLNANGNLGTEDAAQFIESYLDRQVALENAYAAGLDQDVELRRQWENLLIGRLKKTRLNDTLASVSVTDEEVAQYYQANIANYTRPAQVRLALLQLEKQGEDVAEIRERMEEGHQLASELPTDTRGFGALAIKYSEEATSRFKGGDIGWLQAGRSQYRWPEEVIESGFSLSENNELSAVIETDSSFYVLKRLDARDAVVRRLEGRFRSNVQNQILKEKRTALALEIEEQWGADVTTMIHEDVVTQLNFKPTIETPESDKAFSRIP